MVLVTGASGFLGRHLTRYLSDRNIATRALYHNHAPDKHQLALPHVTWHKCDLLDIPDVEEAMQDVTDVYHCAAMVSFDPSKHTEMIHANVESTANVVNQALLQHIRKLVHVSSVAALGRGKQNNNKPITENAEWGDSGYNSAYGLSKYLSEMEVWRGMGEGLNAVIINPGIIMGECKRYDAPYPLLQAAYNEFPFYTEGVTAWVDINDVVKSAVTLMSSTISEQRFIVSGENLGYRAVLTALAKAMNKRPARYKANALLTAIAWRWYKLKSITGDRKPIVTKETAINAGLKCYYSNEKLLQALPEFSYTTVQQSIERMARYFIKSYKN